MVSLCTLAKMAAKQKRVSLTIKRKIELIQKLETGCQKKVAEEYGISAGCVTKMMKEKETFKGLYYSGELDPKFQRPHRVARREEIEHALLQLFKGARSNAIPISGPVLKTKAVRTSKDTPCQGPSTSKDTPRPSTSADTQTDR